MRKHFEGRYYKHQANGRTLAVIPGRSDNMAFILVVTDESSYNIPYPLSAFSKCDKCGTVRVGSSTFSDAGIKLRIKSPGLTLRGDLKYGQLTPINGDIMGPFRFFPMECRHGVISMRHKLRGKVMLNGKTLDFGNGIGYIESDSGVSFPQKYTWVHSNNFGKNTSEDSIMAAVARIPFLGFSFWGVICVVYINGREYRLATYKGVKIIRCRHNLLELKQGKYHLLIEARQKNARKLAAPKDGVMSRIIKESPSCSARFVFAEDGRVIFDSNSRYASYEYCF